MPRIALVTPMLPVQHDPTRGRYIHETARALSRLAQVRVFFQQARYPRWPGMAPRSFIEGVVDSGYQLDGVEVEAFTYPVWPLLSRAINSVVSGHALLPRLRHFQADVVLAYWVYPDGHAALRCARQLGVPCVVGALGSDIHVRSGINAHMTRRTLAGVDALITVSEAMRECAITQFGAAPEKVHTIVNGFNTGVFHAQDQAAARQRIGMPQEAHHIVYVGRLVEAKGMREMLTAFAQLAREDPLARLSLVGDGVMREEVKALVGAAGLQDRVHLPGGLQPTEVATWIAASDLLTLPSWSEGYPNVVVEALACGRPVVATDVGGTREILSTDKGRLVPPKQVEALHAAWTEVLAQPWNHAAIAASMHRSWDDVAKETLAVCESVRAPSS